MATKKTIKDAIEELPLGTRTVEKIFKAIRTTIADNPEAVAEMLPDKQLVEKRMSRRQAMLKAAKASSAKRSEDAKQRYEIIVPRLEQALKENPDASLASLRKVLEDAGIRPARSEKWSNASVLFILRRAGLREN